MIFGFFKKKGKIGIPTIKANAQHRRDDKNRHKLFLSELKDLLKSSNILKTEYIKKYIGLYEKYEPFVGKRYGLIQKQIDFEESLLNPLNKKEANKLIDLIVSIADSRAYNQVELNRIKLLASKVKIKFPESSICCSEVLKYKRKLGNKSILITEAPIFPLKSCVNCDCKIPSHISFLYQIDINS